MKQLLTLLTSLWLTGHCLAQPLKPVATYRNPVIAGDFADPSVIRVGDTYYAVGTSSEWEPAYPLFTSRDLVNWTLIGPVFSTPPDWTMGSFWAPELFYRQGTFYVYYTARRKTDKRSFIGVATTRDLRNGFTDHGLLLEWTTEAIDPFVIEDGGKLYFTWKAYGLDKGRAIEILGAELSPDGLRVTGKPFTLLTADKGGWEAGGAEGQSIVKRGGYFYMLYSGNACCGPRCNYQVGLARAKTLRGPWEKFAKNPVLTSDDSWKCPGHGTLVTTPDNRYFYLHHAYSGTDFTYAGRQGVLSELIWNDQTGWPQFRYGTTTPAQAELPSPNVATPGESTPGESTPGGAVEPKTLNLLVDFAREATQVPWVWDVSQPKPVFAIRQGQLQLAPTATGAGHTQAGTFLGLRILKGTYRLTTDLQPRPDVWQNVCVYGDTANALGLGIRADSLELWQIKDGVRQVLKTQRVPGQSVNYTLQLRSYTGRFFELGWLTTDGKFKPLTDAPLDGSFLPRWDRAPRVGISVWGDPKVATAIRSLRMEYE